MDDENDLAASYSTHVADLSAKARIEEFRKRMGAGAAAPEAVPPTGQAVPKAAAPTAQAVFEQPGIMDRLGQYGTAGAKDIGTGIMESAPAVGGGVTDAVRNTMSSLKSLGDWLEQYAPNPKIEIPLTGSETLDKVLADPFGAAKDAIPTVRPMQSVTGDTLRSMTRFLTGLVATRGAGVTSNIAAGGLAQGLTVNPDDKNLTASLVQQFPSLQGPVTDYLATDPNSPEAVNRLRQGVEGLGFGALTEGIVRGVRYLANARQAAPAAAPALAPEQMAKVTAAPDAPLLITGEKLAKAAAQTETGVPATVSAKGLTGAVDDHAAKAGLMRVVTGKSGPPKGPDDLYINFQRINTPDDIHATINEMAQAFKGEVKTAARGTQSNTQTKALADQLGMTVDDLLQRQIGQPFNAEQSLAARRLLNTSAENLIASARAAAAPNAGEVDQFAFRRAMAMHHAIQSEVIAARTETARALQSWSIPAGSGGQEAYRNIQALMQMTGEGNQAMAQAITAMADAGMPAGALGVVARRGWAATTKDMMQEAYTLGLLWRPTTHIRNIASNTIAAFQQLYERSAANQIGKVLGTSAEGSVVDGEAMAMTIGYVQSMKDAFRLAGRAFKTGESGTLLNKVEIREPAISAARVAEAQGMNAAEAATFMQTPMGRAIDFLGAANRVPGRMLAASDEFFKTIAYSAEINAQAVRKATQEGLSGKPLYDRVAQLVQEPPESIRMAAADAALYATFNNKPGEFVQAVMNLRQSGTLNPTFVVLPYVRTPGNILRYTFERSPIAPLVGQWRADIAAGGARRDLALARISTGTALMSVALDYAASGNITGPGPTDPARKEAMLRTGWQPYSVAMGDKYFKYSGTDPVAMPFAFAGAISDMLKTKELSPEDYDTVEEIVAHAIGAVAVSVVDKSYMQGLSRVVEMLEGAYKGTGGTVRYMDQQTGSLLPFGSLLKTGKIAVDPTTREVNSPWDAVMAQIAGLSERLPPSRDVWGAERAPQEVYGRAYDVAVPFAVSQKTNSPIDNEMVRLNTGVKHIDKKTGFDGVPVNFRDYPEVYDYYVRLAGNELKHFTWGKGAKDFLNDVVTGKDPANSYLYQISSDGPEGGKAAFIKKTISDFRRDAQKQIIAEAPERFPEFYAYWSAKKDHRAEQRFPLDMEPVKPPILKIPAFNEPATPRRGAAPTGEGFAVPTR